MAEEILELKRALNTARHDLQIEKVRNRRRESAVGKQKRGDTRIRSISLLEYPLKGNATGEKTSNGNLKKDQDTKNVTKSDPNSAYLTLKNGLDESIINRELLTKMMSLSEIIRNLSEENESLRQENCKVREAHQEATSQEIQEMQSVVMSYQRQAKEMAERIQDLETQVAEAQTEVFITEEKSLILFPFIFHI